MVGSRKNLSQKGTERRGKVIKRKEHQQNQVYAIFSRLLGSSCVGVLPKQDDPGNIGVVERGVNVGI